MNSSWMKKAGKGLLAVALASSLSVQANDTPGEGGNEINTKLPDGSNYGFRVNTQRIVANKTFTVDILPALKDGDSYCAQAWH